MGYFSHLATLDGDALPYAWGIADMEVIWAGDTPYVFAGAMTDGGINRLELHSDRVAELAQASLAGQYPGQITLEGLSIVTLGGQPHLLGLGRAGEAAMLRQIDPASGQIGASVGFDADAALLRGWSQAISVTLEGRDHMVVARHDEPGLWVYELGAGNALTLRGTVADTTKTALAGISDLAVVTIGETIHLLAVSESRAGVSSLRLGPDGGLTPVDSFGAHVGAGMSGSTALATAEVQGETHAVVASAGSGALTVLRVNEAGVLFPTDHRLDDMHTRFAGVQDIAAFSHEGRAFLVAGGGDDGLSLFELGPGGRLYHLQSIAHQEGWTLQNVQAIEATVIEGNAVILAAGEGAAGLSQFRIDMSRFGEIIMAGPEDADLSGGPGDDHLEAGDRDVTLRGGAGDDRLVAGNGETRLWGGPGEDVFVFRPGGGLDRIMDFEPGMDRIDLRAYPMLYSTAGLDFETTHTGARIRVGEDVIVVRTHDLIPLAPGDFGNGDFIFG
ncbi:hypothetical protein [Alkalilacustris brevis]|uniref:hypothetical protein n=1 Tax=Alkalilacustris brevis TaxID=2026338 RepID=UPI000E0E05F4|nr:hypothetical protein [Alkalilacustris brevis]